MPGSSTSLAILNGLLAEVPSIEQFAARQDSGQLLPLPRTNDAQGAEVNAADWFAELAGEATVLRVFVLRSAAIHVFLPRVVTRETAGSLLAFAFITPTGQTRSSKFRFRSYSCSFHSEVDCCCSGSITSGVLDASS